MFLNVIYFLLTQAADELREQEVRQKNDEIQQKSAQLEQTQVLNPVYMQMSILLPIPLPLPKTTICMTVVYLKGDLVVLFYILQIGPKTQICQSYN